MRNKRTVGEWKDIESDFYTNDSPNDDLEALEDALRPRICWI
jgi:hypothetical protein